MSENKEKLPWLILISEFLYSLGIVMRKNLVSIIMLILFYLFLWETNQGQDLLLTINQEDKGKSYRRIQNFFYLINISFFAVIIWVIPLYRYSINAKTLKTKELLQFNPFNQIFKKYDLDNDKIGYNSKEDIEKDKKENDKKEKNEEEKNEGEMNVVIQNYLHIKFIFPRLLASLVFIISALGILNAMNDFGYSSMLKTNPFTYLISQNLYICLFIVAVIYVILLYKDNYYYLLKYLQKIKFWNKSLFITVVIIFVLLLLILPFIFLYENYKNVNDLRFLFFINIYSYFLFWILSSYSIGQSLFNKIKVPKINVLKSGSLKNKVYFKEVNFKITPFIYGLALCYLLFYLLINLFYSISNFFNPLSIFLVVLIFYQLLIGIIQFIGKKHRIEFLSMLTLPLVTYFSVIHYFKTDTHYQLPLVQNNNAENRKFLNDYIDSWLDEKVTIELLNTLRKDTLKYPIYFVMSEGGGSIAGLWSSSVHNYLQEQSNGSYFKDHLFLLTGASGGAVGNSLFFNKCINEKLQSKNGSLSNDSHFSEYGNFYSENFLSASLLSGLGRDYILSSLPKSTNRYCRSEIIEDQWNNSYKKHINNDSIGLKTDLLNIYQNNPNIPLLINNTTHVQSGKYTYISPVRIKKHTYRISFKDFKSYYPTNKFINKTIDSISKWCGSKNFTKRNKLDNNFKIKLNEKLDSLNSTFLIDKINLDNFECSFTVSEKAAILDFFTLLHEIHNKESSINLSTAMVLTSTFPIVNSSYSIPGVGQFVDAGYYDNIGGIINEEVLKEFKFRLKNHIKKLYKKENDDSISIESMINCIALKPVIIQSLPYYSPKEVNYTPQALIPVQSMINVRSGHSQKEIYNNKYKKIVLKPKKIIINDTVSSTQTQVLPLGRYLSHISIKTIEKEVNKNEVLNNMVKEMKKYNLSRLNNEIEN